MNKQWETVGNSYGNYGYEPNQHTLTIHSQFPQSFTTEFSTILKQMLLPEKPHYLFLFMNIKF